MILQKNTNNENLQYATTDLKKRANEHLDSVVMHTFMRIAHIKKEADGFKSQYLHMGHFSIVYAIWVWIPIQARNKHWFKSKELQKAISKYLKFDMAMCNVNKYLKDLCILGLLEHRTKGFSFMYRIKPLTDK
jgi:hypothetical protein